MIAEAINYPPPLEKSLDTISSLKYCNIAYLKTDLRIENTSNYSFMQDVDEVLKKEKDTIGIFTHEWLCGDRVNNYKIEKILQKLQNCKFIN